MAERVGFVPVVPSPINNLGLIESPQSTKSTQNLNIRYKTGTAKRKIPSRLPPNRSRDLDERLTSFERGDDVGEVGFYPTEQLCLPCVADPDPDDGGTALQ